MNDAENDFIRARTRGRMMSFDSDVIVTKVHFCSSIYKPFDVSDATIDLLRHVL